METLELFQRLSVALAIGLLIGLERGWQTRGEAEGERAAGFRTHALAGVLGGVWGALARGQGEAGLIALALAFIAFVLPVTLFRFRETQHERTYGATTLVAAMLAFSLGAYALLGNMQVAAAAGVVVTGLLAMKSVLHAWVKRMTWEELRSVLVLAAMTFIMLPVLPDRAIDPWGAVNPFEIWLMTVMIAVISFTGYVAIKMFGDESGIALTGVAGGLVSSTAVTLNMAQLAKEHPGRTNALVAGAMLSSATMMARVLAVVAIINAALLPQLAPALAAAGLVLAGGALWLLARNPGQGEDNKPLVISNPLDLGGVLKFGALLTVIIVLSKVATGLAGSAGAYLLALASGVADVDAITLSMARLGHGALGGDVAARAIALVVASNTVAKTVIGWVAGGAEFGRHLALAAGVAIVAGIVGLMAGIAMV